MGANHGVQRTFAYVSHHFCDKVENNLGNQTKGGRGGGRDVWPGLRVYLNLDLTTLSCLVAITPK